MFDDLSLTNEKKAPAWPDLLSLTTVILAAVAMRAWVNFSSPLPPGTDAAYYPLQARALLEHGRLAYSDLPLAFALDAAIAQVLALFGGLKVNDSVLLAARIADTVLQPLLAVALFALGWAWGRGASRAHARAGLAVGLGAAAMFATVSLPMLRMTGDYEKNSIGLVWLACAAWALHAALSDGGWVRWTFTGVAVLLAGLTHVAAFGAAVVLVAATALAYLAVARRLAWRRMAAALAAGILFAGLALACVALASPRRGIALLSAPVELFRSGREGSPLDPLGLLVCASVYAILAWGAWTLWRQRGRTVAPQFAAVAGAGVCAALLACPLLNEEFFKRLVLMAPVPASVVLVYVMTRRAEAGKRMWPAWLVAALSLLSVAAGLGGGELSRGIMPAVIEPDGAQELLSAKSLVGDPARTVVLARKGLMWWAGFLMEVPVREDSAASESIAKYEHVLVLEEKGAPGDRGGGPAEPPRERPGDRRPGGPGGRRPGPPEPPERRPEAGANRVGPSVYDGAHYRLYEITNATGRAFPSVALTGRTQSANGEVR